MLQIGVVRYGTGGQHFHVPFVLVAKDVALAGVVARAPATIAKVRADLPDVSIFPSLSAMIAAGGLDAVTITTPPKTRREQSSDVQAQAIFAGKRPADDPDGWGYEPEACWGALRTAAGTERVPAEQGRYHDYYEAFARAVHESTPRPVTAASGVRMPAVLDAARLSAAEGRSVPV